MIIVSRFGHTSPMIIQWLYGISRAQSLAHLNGLCREGLLEYALTHRSPDDRVYTMTRIGAMLAEQLTAIPMQFRSTEHVAQRLNLSTLYHDLIVQYLMLRGMSEQYFNNGDSFGGWDAFVTDAEFRKIARKNDIRNVDGVVREPDGTVCAVEMEHSFKNPENRKNILLKYADSLTAGYYQKIMLFSQKLEILKDAKRIHEQAITYLTENNRPKSNQPWLSEDAAEMLRGSLVYRTKFCDELSERFYR